MSHEPSLDHKTRMQQLRHIKAAYNRLTPTTPYLPPHNSPLPALLAIDTTQRTIAELRESILATNTDLSQARRRLSSEEADLKDSHLITEALEKRIEKLQLQWKEKSHRSPDEAAKDLLLAQQSRITALETETKGLVKALTKFIKDHLATMLAAEELGGPVVGNMLDISDTMLKAGFHPPNTTEMPQPQKGTQDNARQQRINQIWGLPDATEKGARGYRSERQAAAADMRSLTEDLLNLAAEEGAEEYLTVQRNSAAVRFLVRAKVAQFHPEDPMKLRLVDFGRGMDD